MIVAKKRGIAIRMVRKHRDLSLKQLAAKIGVSAGCISLIENGKRDVSTDLQNKLGRVLQIPPAFFAVLGTDLGNSRNKELKELVKSLQDAIIASINGK